MRDDSADPIRQRLAQWARRLGALQLFSQSVLWIVLALGVTLLVGAVLEPLWPIRLFLDVLPQGLLWLIDHLGIDATTALGLYGAILTLVAAVVFAASRRYAFAGTDPAELDADLEHLRERVVRLREHVSLRFLVVLGFVVGFVGARTVVVIGGLAGDGTPSRVAESLPIGEIWWQGYHIHHFFFGFAALVAVGWLAVFYPGSDRRWLAVLYGLGMGIFVDEVGLLITWGDYYARSSWFAAALFLSLVVAGMVWTFDRAKERVEETTRGRQTSLDEVPDGSPNKEQGSRQEEALEDP